MNTLGTIIRNAREAKHLSMRKFSQNIGIKATTMYNWEHGATKPSPENLRKICDALGITEEMLAEMEEHQESGGANVMAHYATRPIMLHAERWDLAEELRPYYDAVDLSQLFDRLLIEAKRAKMEGPSEAKMELVPRR